MTYFSGGGVAIGVMNDINDTKYCYFSFSHILHIWQETACDTQIVSQLHITQIIYKGHDADIFFTG